MKFVITWSEEKHEELINMWKTGITQRQIAEHFEVTSNSIAGRILRLRRRGADIARRPQCGVAHSTKKTKPSASTPKRGRVASEKPDPNHFSKRRHLRPKGPKINFTRDELRKMLEEAMVNTARMQSRR